METLKVLIKGLPDKSKLPLDYLIGTQGLFIQLLNKSKSLATPKDVEEYRNEEIIVSTVLCLDVIIADSANTIPDNYLRNVGDTLLSLMYSANAKTFGEIGFCSLMSTSLGK